LIASFIIFFDRPFRVGDLLKVQQIQGTVEKIGLRSTRIRTNDTTYVSIPNKQMVDSIVDNFSLRNKRRGELNLNLDLDTSFGQITQLIEELNTELSLSQITEKSILLSDVKLESFLVTIEYYTDAVSISDYNMVKQKLNMKVLALLEKLEIKIAGKLK